VCERCQELVDLGGKPNNHSLLRPAGGKNEQKKPELEALAFPNNPPFYVINNK